MGVVVKTKKSQQEISQSQNIPVFTSLKTQTLKEVDAVDIVTPYPTHYSLVKKCLPYTNVFVEKPLTDSSEQSEELTVLARKYHRFLMVGHIYRFHPLIPILKRYLRGMGKITINGRFISPQLTFRKQDPLFECFHFFDILDNLFGKVPTTIWCTGNFQMTKIDLRYPGVGDAHFQLGWQEEIKERILEFKTSNKTVICDFGHNRITLVQKGKSITKEYPLEYEPLEKELTVFVDLLKGKKQEYPDGQIGTRIVGIAEKGANSRNKKKLRVAVIGGGIFGTTCALLLGKHFPVTLFEKNSDILGEASWANQYRHHWGYHYPRSPETIAEIQSGLQDFEDFYKPVIETVPSYYCVAKEGSNVSVKQFSEVCRKHHLPFMEGYPPAAFLNRDTVSFCIKVPEGIYNYKRLMRFTKSKIANNPNIVVKTNHCVVGASLNGAGKKILKIQRRKTQIQEKFDYVINATYARYNVFCDRLGFQKKNLKFRLKEVIVLSIDTKQKCAISIMDGPFATILPTQAAGNLYTFGDVLLSVFASMTGVKSAAVEDKRWGSYTTRWAKVKKRCLQWYPLLEKAKYIKSMFVILPTEMTSEVTAARPTSVTSHGFGCWSIFSGKIVHCVTTAKKILEEIEFQTSSKVSRSSRATTLRS